MLFSPESFGCCRHIHCLSALQACPKNNDIFLKHNPIIKLIIL